MRRQPDRRRLTWIVLGGAGLLVAILFIAAMAPSGSSSSIAPPVLRPDVVAADAAAGQQAAPSSTGGSSGFHLGLGGAASLAWRLGLVAVILGGSVAGLRWWGKRSSGPKSVTGFLRVVDTLAISNGRTIHLVALGDRVIAIGATTQQLTLLNELEPEEAKRILASLPVEGEQPFTAFASELFQSMRGVPARKRPARHDATLDEIGAPR